MGSAAAQIAKSLGARVIGVNLMKDVAPKGVPPLEEFVLDSLDPKLPELLRSTNNGKGADVVLNTAGGPMFEIGLKLLARRGRQTEITTPTERRASFDVVDFYHNESRLIGLDTLKRDLLASSRVLAKLAEGFVSGAYRVHPIDHTLPLEDARHAYELVSTGSGLRVALNMSAA